MSLYVVDESGSLTKEVCELEYLEPKNPKSKNLLDRLPTTNIVSKAFQKTQETSLIRFYEHICKDKYSNDYSIKYSCKIIDGQLDIDSLKLIKFTSSDNSERKLKTRLWIDKIEANKKFHNKWYVRCTYGVYSRFIRFVFRNLRKVIRWLDTTNWKIEKFLTPL